jgi:PAS domain S-box-containing protein
MAGAINQIRVLHVDDEPDLADLVATYLEDEDDRLVVETAHRASEGMELLDDRVFDCVISDYDMPGMDGIDFLATVREEYLDLPFILFTGKGSEEVASEAIATGVSDYLQKQAGTEQYELLANRVTNAVEQYHAQQEAATLRRIRDIVADVNRVLVHASSRQEIEAQICEIIASAEFYRFAWIGEHNPETGTVDPRTSAGIHGDYLDGIEVRIDESATGQGPTGRAVREREIATMQNIPEAEEYEPWREEALERGYRSSAAIPLLYEEDLYGILNVYADRTDAFDEREQGLLAELAGDIGHALHHQQVRQELRSERDRFRHLVEGIENYAIFMLDAEGNVATWNAGAEQIKGYTEEEIVGQHYRKFFPRDAIEQGRPEELLATAEREGVVEDEDWRLRKDGSQFHADITLTALYDDEGSLRGFAKVTRNMSDQ